MNPIVQIPARAGELLEVEVPGCLVSGPNPENEVDQTSGRARTMFVYVPASGCPHPKQTQVLFVYRDTSDRSSAEALIHTLGLATLAERKHFILVLPNPTSAGWECEGEAASEDAGYIVRCFAALKGACGASGFNGMMFHLASTPLSSAFIWTFALSRPLDAAAIMLGAFPEAYTPALGAGAPQAAWFYDINEAATAYVAKVNGASNSEPADSLADNPSIGGDKSALLVFNDGGGLNASSVVRAWDNFFSRIRRWRNDTFGTYALRTQFEERGFVAHRNDISLGLADGLPRTWYEYVAPQLRGTQEPVPLVIYLHGINCMGLYGAEQSGWDVLAERDGFMCVFPDATAGMRWNGWADDRLPSDIDYILALIEHMDSVHPLDRSRIYLSGFSMGSMFTNVLAAAYPEVFAGAVAFNGPMSPYFNTLDKDLPETMQLQPGAADLRKIEPRSEDESPIHRFIDAKWSEKTCGVPFVQFVGLIDNVGFAPGHIWPVQSTDDGSWLPTISYRLAANGLANTASLDTTQATGIASPFTTIEGSDGRFIHQAWESDSQDAPYHLIGVKHMPHAVDMRGVEMGWEIVKRYARSSRA